MPTDRKEFLRKAGSVALFASLGISLASCSDSSTGPEDTDDSTIDVEGSAITIDLSTPAFQALQNQNGMILSLSGGFLAVNVDGNTIRAFSNVCTHAACDNDWQLPGDQFVCTCHNSVFNLNGQPISGPAQRDLPEYEVVRDGLSVTITKS